MRQKRCALLRWVTIWILVAFAGPADLGAAPLKKIRAAFSAFAYANPPFWIAKELKLFEKYGLEAELVYVQGSKPIAAMLGGSIDVSQVGGAAAVSAASRGAEVAIVGTVFTRLVFAVHASPQIKEVADLKGKVMAAGAVGGNSYFAALLFLSKMGWAPNKDVGLIGAGGSPEVLAAMQQGKFHAGVMAPPTTTMAERLGFRQLFDIASLDLPFPTISVVSTRKFIAENPDTILNVLRASAEAIHWYKTRPDLTLPVVAKYMRVSKDDPYRVCWDLGQLLDRRNTILLHDAGVTRAYVSHHYEALFPKGFIGFGGTSAMGWSIPAGMGAKLAHPDKAVVVVTGDGSFGMTGMEIETAVRHDIRTLTVILNNALLGASRETQVARFEGREIGVHQGGDYAALARSLGAFGERIERPQDLKSTVARALAHSGPAVLEIPVKPLEPRPWQ